jgi:hypothetical protein
MPSGLLNTLDLDEVLDPAGVPGVGPLCLI